MPAEFLLYLFFFFSLFLKVRKNYLRSWTHAAGCPNTAWCMLMSFEKKNDVAMPLVLLELFQLEGKLYWNGTVALREWEKRVLESD